MQKKLLIIATISGLYPAAGLAGPYINAETNAGWLGNDYQEATTDLHLGFEDKLGEKAEWYIQAGPALALIDDANANIALSGKTGVGMDVTESLNLYGELSALTSRGGNLYFAKVGAKYKL